MALPPIAKDAHCCSPGCLNPATHADVFEGMGVDPVTDEPYKRVRAWCAAHIRHPMNERTRHTNFQTFTLDEYREYVAAQRVKEALRKNLPPEGPSILPSRRFYSR